MRFRIDSEEMLGRLKERSAEIENTLGMSLPVVSGHTSFSELSQDCCALGWDTQTDLDDSEFTELAQEALDGMAKGKVKYLRMKEVRLKIPEAFLRHFDEDKLCKNGTANMYFSQHFQVLDEDGANATVSATIEARGFFGNRLFHVEQILRGKKTRILAKLFGDKIVAKVTARMPLTYKGRVMLTDEYIPEWYLKLEKDENLDSCMSHTASWYGLESNEHPTLAYEGLKTTYLGLVYDEVKDRVVGRSVVKYKKLEDGSQLMSNRTYGSAVAHTIVNNSTDGGFNSLTMKRIESSDGGTLCPYVDGLHDDGYEITDKYIRTGGDCNSSYETGRIEQEGKWCDYYEEYVDSNDTLTYIDGYGQVCEAAIENEFTYVEGRDAYVHNDDVVWVESEHEWYHCDDVASCDYSGEYYPSSEVKTITVDDSYYDVAEDNIVDFVQEHVESSDIITNVDTCEVLFDREQMEEENNAA